MAGVQRSPIMSGLMHLRAKFTRNFTILPNFLLRRRGSAVVLGIAAYLFSLPEGTPMSIERLCRHFTEGRVRISRALRELEEDGYLERRLYRLADGTVRTRFVLHHLPEAARRFAEAGRDTPPVDEPTTEPVPAAGPAPPPVPAPLSRPVAEAVPASVACPVPEPSAVPTPRVGPVPVDVPAPRAVPAARLAPVAVPAPVKVPAPRTVPVPILCVAEIAPDRVPANGGGLTPRVVADRRPASPPVVTSPPRVSPTGEAPAPGPGVECREPAVPVTPVAAPTRWDTTGAPVPAPTRPVSRAARTVLDSLTAHDPRLLLSERELHDLAPAVDTWLERGVPGVEVARALTTNLPRPLTHRPARLLAHRLTAFLPAHRLPRTASTASPPPAAPSPWRTCSRCDRVAFRSAVHTLCTGCRESPPGPDTGPVRLPIRAEDRQPARRGLRARRPVPS
ncbi:hypothetical protein [Streptomyces alkaliphilus]|uniref:hypothetical protein n=1 Tax=Streptomyces alkaliphilus TaxID=1472722 RepID=UPI00117E3354|nr:hypothetical protein [Streptomyces alkaliphilus]MQS08711.1 hypothetical protein [Streptomyces alkaliphilus]